MASPKAKDKAKAAAQAQPNLQDKKTNAPSSSSALWFVVVPLIVALIGGAWTTLAPLGGLEAITRELTGGNLSKNDSASTAYVLKDKYESELMPITTQKLLSPSPTKETCASLEIVGDLTAVAGIMDEGAHALREQNQVFLMLNGQNDGLRVHWEPKQGCLQELALLAAQALGADVDELSNGVKLFTPMGLPITTPEQLDTEAGRIAHVLLDFQIWVWPGIKIGHEFEVEGVKVKTLSMVPKVFSIEGFFTQEEADSIIEQGLDRLSRSPVDSPEAVDGYHSDRTSFTAFLHDNQFTRDFRVRTAKLARLPSPSFVERMQLVRYETGQFFRKHEDYFDSKQFIPKQEESLKEFEAWTIWAGEKLKSLRGTVDLPRAYLPIGELYPNFQDKSRFQHALLRGFMEDAAESDFFVNHGDVEWKLWIEENLNNTADDIIGPLMRDKGYMLAHIIKSWEKRVALPELKYTIPRRPVSGVSQYFRFIRWAKERVQDVMDEDLSAVPASIRPEGADYPTYNMHFQNILANYMLQDYSEELLVDLYGREWYDWLVLNKENKDVIIEALRSSPNIFDRVVETWTKRAGDKFVYS